MSEINITSCPLCSGREFEPRLQDRGLTILSCRHCGLAWRREDTVAERSVSLPISFAPPAFGPDAVILDTAQPSPQQTPFDVGAAEIEEINSLRRPPGNLLNVGANCGDVLETARMSGWSSEACVELPLARCPRKKVEGRCAAPDSKRSSSAGFDVIRLDGSLENSLDPVAYLDQALTLLHENGLIVICASDYSAWEFPLWGQGENLLPEALPRWFFALRTFEVLLWQCQMTLLKITRSGLANHYLIFACRAERRELHSLKNWDACIPPHHNIEPSQPMLLSG